MNKRKALTIFGGTGDLTFRKLLPALYNMWMTGQMGEEQQIVIIGRRSYTTEEYRTIAKDWVKQFARISFKEDEFERFSQKVSYYQMDFTDIDAYIGLNTYYQNKEIKADIFYFAVAPRFFQVIVQGLKKVEGSEEGKVIIEKPFGENLEKAKELNQRMEAFFKPEHIFRIDHYLGKEMVRNIQTIRFTNPIFSNIWNSKNIEYIQISAMEDVGVEQRGGYYDQSGALRDMVQNHLLQILTIVAMERPNQFYGDKMHREQIRVLEDIRQADQETIADTLLLAQYEGYRSEASVAADSQTETYAALRLFIDNERWEGMPFYIRTGKKLGKREMEVAIVFKRSSPEMAPNILRIKIQPTEGVDLQFNIKRPGDFDEVIETKMDFCQNCSLANRINTPEAYERMLNACMKGDRSWFSQWDQIETSWQHMDQFHDLYHQQNLPIYSYKIGSDGPKESDDLLKQFGHKWI